MFDLVTIVWRNSVAQATLIGAQGGGNASGSGTWHERQQRVTCFADRKMSVQASEGSFLYT
jgi:hypothetical protein